MPQEKEKKTGKQPAGTGEGPEREILKDGARAFVEFAQTKSVLEASKRIGKSQPSASRDIAGLEASLGVELLDRSVRPIRLTPEGAALAKFLDAEQDRLGKFLSGLREANAIRPPVGIGICESLDWSFSHVIATRLSDRFSTMRLEIGSSGTLIPGLYDGALDMLFCSNPFLSHEDLVRIPVFEEPSVLIFPETFSLASLPRPLRLQDLRTCGLPHVRCSKKNESGVSETSFFAKLELEFPSRIVVNENALLLQLVASGSGWAIARPTSLAQHPELALRVKAVPIPESAPSRRASVVIRKGGRYWVAEAVAEAARVAYREDVAPIVSRILPWAAKDLFTFTGTEPGAFERVPAIAA